LAVNPANDKFLEMTAPLEKDYVCELVDKSSVPYSAKLVVPEEPQPLNDQINEPLAALCEKTVFEEKPVPTGGQVPVTSLVSVITQKVEKLAADQNESSTGTLHSFMDEIFKARLFEQPPSDRTCYFSYCLNLLSLENYKTLFKKIL